MASPRLVRSRTVPSSTPVTVSAAHWPGIAPRLSWSFLSWSGLAWPDLGWPSLMDGRVSGCGSCTAGGIPPLLVHGGSPLSIARYASAALISGTDRVFPSGNRMLPADGALVDSRVALRNHPLPYASLVSLEKRAPSGSTVRSSSGTKPSRPAVACDARQAAATSAARRSKSASPLPDGGASPEPPS